jgi:hypothetical protein
MNNTIILDHHGLFVYINTYYPKTYYEHFVTLERLPKLIYWYYIHGNDYFEYFLGDPRYIGEKMFIIMHRIRQQEFAPYENHDAMQTFDNMHTSFKFQVQWEISELKRKWRHFMKKFDSTKLKYTHLFQIAILFIDFLHMRCMDVTFKVVGDENLN